MNRVCKLFFIFILLVFFMSACGVKEVDFKDQSSKLSGGGEYEDAPDWVLDLSMEGGLSALGIAKIGPAGMQFARNEAMANGRSELARIINLKVKDLVKNFTQKTGVNESAVVDKVSTQVSKQVAKQTLIGSRAKKVWISPEKNLHILMVLDPTLMKDSIQEAVRSSYKNDQALWQQFQAKKGHEELENEIEKEFGDFKNTN